MSESEYGKFNGHLEDKIKADSPEHFLESLRLSKSVPILDPDTINRLESQMSEEQIIEYYVTLKDIAGDNDIELTSEQIIKPKKIYHASPSGDIDMFTPRAQKTRRRGDPPQIYGTPSEIVASMFMVATDDSFVISGSYDHGRTWTYIIGDINKFNEFDNGGWIYTLPNETFEVDPNLGLGVFEWTSTAPVSPIGRHYKGSGMEAMLESGIKDYVVDSEMFGQMRSGEDQISLLQNLKPLQSKEK